MENAQFAANRLRTLQPRLVKRLAHVQYSEAHARWLEQYTKVKAKRDAAASELREVYPRVAAQLADLLSRARAIDAEIRQVSALDRGVRLPDFTRPAESTWPPHVPRTFAF